MDLAARLTADTLLLILGISAFVLVSYTLGWVSCVLLSKKEKNKDESPYL